MAEGFAATWEGIPYRIRLSERARRARITASPDRGLEVVLPSDARRSKTASRAEAEAILRQHAAWVQRQWRRLEGEPRPEPIPLVNGAQLPYLGGSLVLSLVEEPGRLRPRVVRKGNELAIRFPGEWTGGEREQGLRRLLDGWYHAEARVLLAERVALYHPRFPRAGALRRPLPPVQSIRVRAMRTRWGSCSRSGNLHFNERLVWAPLDLVDYVVIHELAHLREPNHSNRFWRLVAAVCPDWAERRRRLRRLEPALLGGAIF